MEHQQHWCLELNLQTGKSNLNRQTLSLNHSQTPTCYYFNAVSELEQAASKNKFKAAKSFSYCHTASLWVEKSSQDDTIYSCDQYFGNCTVTVWSSRTQKSFYTLISLSRRFKFCRGKLEKTDLEDEDSNKHNMCFQWERCKYKKKHIGDTQVDKQTETDTLSYTRTHFFPALLRLACTFPERVLTDFPL